MPEPIVVLMSYGPPHDETNPYLVQLFESLPRSSVEPRHFSWRQALLGEFDVFHLHWPEVKMRGTSPAGHVYRTLLFAIVLCRIRIQGKALVRTLHNRGPHEPLARPQAWLLRWCDRLTTWWVTLSDQTPPPTAAPATTIPIGHYRDWFAPAAAGEPPAGGSILHFGIVRRYKGVDALLEAFGRTDDTSLELRIVGKIADADLDHDIRRVAGADSRVTVVDAYVADEVLAAELSAAALVVLPFEQVTNSSSLLLALSFDRPVLAPAGPVIDEIAAEVGPAWVLRYDGRLTDAALDRAISEVRSEPRTGAPDLDRREWPRIGAAHAAVYRAAHRGLDALPPDDRDIDQ